MSEDDSQNRNKPLRNNSQTKMLTIWALVFFAMISLLFLAKNDGTTPETLTISQLVVLAQGDAIDGKTIVSATMQNNMKGGLLWHEVKGELVDLADERTPFVARGQLTESNLCLLYTSDAADE